MVSEEQPESVPQSPIDIFLSSPEFERVLGEKPSVLRIEKDDAERYLAVSYENRFTKKGNTRYEAFLSKHGNRVFSRHTIYLDFYRSPMVAIEGYEGDLEWGIERSPKYFNIGGVRTDSFGIGFSVIVMNERHRITYVADYGYHGNSELVILYSPKDTAIINSLPHKIRFVGTEATVWVGHGLHNPIASSALDREIFDPIINYSYRLERGETPSRMHIYKMTTKDLNSGRQIILDLPNWVDIEEWDEKIRVLNRSWRDLGKQMPISLEIIG